MGFVQYPLCCHSNKQKEQEQEPQPQGDHHLHSQSSTSSSLSSQPSLPNVPSLTPLSHNLQQPQTTHHQLITTIKPHSSPIFSLSLHGKFLYSASSSGEITTCSRDPFILQTPNTTNVVAISNSAVKSLIIFNNKLFTAHQDHKIRVWKTDPNERFKCIATLPTFNDRFSKMFSSNNYIEIRRHKKCTWVHHVDTVSALALSKDGSLLYSASWDRTFKIWRTRDFKCLESVNAHEDAINALVISNDGVLYTGSADKKIKIWKKNEDEKKHSLLGTLEKHKSAVNALALSTDGSVLYSGACDRSILVWENDDANNNNNNKKVLVGALRGHTKAILCLVVMDDLVCSGSADNSVRIWRRGIEKSCYSCLAVLQGHTRPVKSLAMAMAMPLHSSNTSAPHDDTASSYLIYSASLDSEIKAWQLRLL
ncbi:hypothetical protein VNO77_40019 [Canavalia gladiata]|uniref:Uncharacterized protein n=1 Tax=Canavalia gladiata TaxID=3824 RepID=A0AAN9PR43_CANGL